MMDLVKEKLITVDLFKNFNEEEMSVLMDYLDVNTYKKKECLTREGHEDADLYIILSGAVRVMAHKEKKNEVQTYMLKEGEFFQEKLFYEYDPVQVKAEAMEECRVAEIKKENFDLLYRYHKDLYTNILLEISKRMVLNYHA